MQIADDKFRRTGSYGPTLTTREADLSALTEQLAAQQTELQTIRVALGVVLEEVSKLRALPEPKRWPDYGAVEVVPGIFLTVRAGEPVELRADGPEPDVMERRAERWFKENLAATHHLVPSGYLRERSRPAQPMYWESMRLRRGGTLVERFAVIRPGPLPPFRQWEPAHMH